MSCYDLAPEDCSAEIWLYAIASRHNMLSPEELAVFSLEYIDVQDPFFNGLYKVRDIQVYAAVDFDPAGMRIALDFNVDAILIPEQYEKLRLQPNINKDVEFDKQNNKKCESMIPLNWIQIWNWIHDSRTAIIQESILIKNWPIRALYK